MKRPKPTKTKTKTHPLSRQTEPDASQTLRRFSRDLVFHFKNTTPKSQKKGKQ